MAKKEERTGEWIEHSKSYRGVNGIDYYYCGQCGSDAHEKTDFCPNCHARMVKPTEEKSMSVQDITEALKICKCYEDDEPCKQCPIREKEWDGAWEDALGMCYIQLMRQAAEVLSHTAPTEE